MAKISSLLLVLSLVLASGYALADDGGVNPGYMTSVSTGTIVKSGYGECVHDTNWEPAYGAETCGEAPTQTTVTNFSESSVQLFTFNTSRLSESGVKSLTNFVRKIKAKGGTINKISVVGYTDQIGADVYNQRLSLERANSIKIFLISQGLDGDTITPDGLGEDDSIASEGCFKKYGTAGLDRINNITARDATNTPAQRKVMDAELLSYSNSHKELVACAAPDRRVEITVVQLKQTVTPAE